MLEIRTNPSPRELRWFGLLLALFFAIIGSLLRWQFHAPTAALVIWPLGAALALLYYAIPPLRRPMYIAWMYLAFPVGWLISHLLMAIIFYLVFTPIGLLMRLFGYDPMRRRFEPDTPSYWVEHDPAGDPARYFRQF